MKSWLCIIVILAGASLNVSKAQNTTSIYSKVLSFPDKLLGSLQKKSTRFEERLTAKTEKYLQQLAKQEKRMQKKLAKTDSLKAAQLFGKSQDGYRQLQENLHGKASKLARFSSLYSGHADSMQTALRFLDQNNLLSKLSAGGQQFQNVLNGYKGVQDKFNQAAAIRSYLDERKRYLKSQLQNTPLAKEFRKYQQELYYYKAQLDEYKSTFEDPEKLETKLLQAVRNLPAFKSFFSKYSQLAALFPQPENYGSMASLAGLQTRASVQGLIQTQLAAGGQNAQAVLQQNLGEAKSMLSQLKERVNKLGNAGADFDMPDFKPNKQRTKSFLQRIDFGTSFSSNKGTSLIPNIADAGLTAGYKLNDKSEVGAAVSYKLGLGKGINHISFSNQGIGFRSFLDLKLKGNIWISGGFEYNYMKAFKDLETLYHLDAWQESALIGISKKYKISPKKSSSIQLLYDILYRQHLPQSQPVVFRVKTSLF